MTEPERRLTLVTGEIAVLRPLTADDGPALQDLLAHMSPTSVYRRFAQRLERLEGRLLEQLLNVDGRRRFAVVAEVGGQIVAVARYASQGDRRADVALAVDDQYQHLGLGSALLEALAAHALATGLRHLAADVLAVNRPALRMLTNSGFAETHRLEGGFVHFDLRIGAPEAGSEDATYSAGGTPPST